MYAFNVSNPFLQKSEVKPETGFFISHHAIKLIRDYVPLEEQFNVIDAVSNYLRFGKYPEEDCLESDAAILAFKFIIG